MLLPSRFALAVIALCLTLAGTAGCGPRKAPSSGAAMVAPRPAPPLRPAGEPSGTCPDLKRSGMQTLTSAGVEREAIVLLPPGSAEGAPVLFVWHGLGATAKSMVPRMGLRELALAGAVVVAPQALPGSSTGWTVDLPRVDDMALFDDLRACLHRDLQVDLHRVVSSGFSAGGLWTSLLLFKRSDALAGVLEMSGGVIPPILSYETPAWSTPALLFDGGRTDTYRKGPLLVRFDQNTAKLRDRLRRDGHLVVHCPHDRGHRVVSWRIDLIHRWALSQRYGEARPLDEPPVGCAI